MDLRKFSIASKLNSWTFFIFPISSPNEAYCLNSLAAFACDSYGEGFPVDPKMIPEWIALSMIELPD
eukprot:5142609-Amphidinium_carterae.1